MRASKRYAKALITLAAQEDRLELVKQDATLLRKLIHESVEFKRLLNSPIISPRHKQEILQKLLDKHIHSTTTTFLFLMVKNGRENKLEEVINYLEDYYHKLTNKTVAQVTTSKPMTETQREWMQKKVREIIKQPKATIVLEEKVNQNIIGGFILQIEDRQYDASIKHKLKNLRTIAS